jgi:N-acetylmuramoyl-L-alanine amidase
MKNTKPGHSMPVVCLDAGHYGKSNRSPAVPEYYESDMTWALHLLLKTELEKYGIQVITTRADKDRDLDVVARGMAAADSDLFISVHSNAAGNPNANYVLGIHQVDDNCGELDEQSKEIAVLLSNAVAAVMGAEPKTWSTQSSEDRDGNGYKDDYYGVLRGAHSVHTHGVILEHGFHTNKEQAAWLMDKQNLQRLAEAEAATIARWFDVEKKEEIPEPEHWYRIRQAWDKPETQLGAYKVLELAIQNCPEGYSVFDWNGETVYYNGGGEPVPDGKELFIRELQAAIGAAVDGIAGPETLSKTPTLSAKINVKHPAVKPVQSWLYSLGYHEVGVADGIAGPKFASAVAHYQQDNGCVVDGEITARNKTWRKLLGLE